MAKYTGYLSVFEDKLETLRKKAKDIEGKKGDQKLLDRLKKEIRDIEVMLEDMRDHDQVKVTCPCCGESFRVDADKVKLKTS